MSTAELHDCPTIRLNTPGGTTVIPIDILEGVHVHPEGLRLDANDPRRGGIRPPDAIERDYRQYLKGRLDEIRRRVTEAIEEWLTEERKRALDQRADAFRADQPDDPDDVDVASWARRMASIRMSWERQRDVLQVREEIERVGAQTDAFNREQQRRVFEEFASIDPIDSAETGELMDEFARENVDLITGQDGLEDRALRQIEEESIKALREGKRHEEFAKVVEERLGVAESRAELIARDQIASLNGQLTARRHAAAGVTKFEWQTAQDERVRDTHEMLNGEIFRYDDPPSEGLPGEPINCRCVAIPVFEFEDRGEVSDIDPEPTASGTPPSQAVEMP